MKRIFTVLMVLLALIISPFQLCYAQDIVKVYVNGHELTFDQPPVIVDGRTLIPVRAVSEAFGLDVSWSPEANTACICKNNGEQQILITINSKIAIVNGKPIELDVPAKLINGRTMVPLRFIGESLNANVDWDGNTSTVSISTYNSSDLNQSGTFDNGSPIVEDSTQDNDAPLYWYDYEYTQPISDTLSKYFEQGVGFSVIYPSTWCEKPKVSSYDANTILTCFYEDADISITSSSTYINPAKGFEEYLKDTSKDLKNKTIFQVKNGYTAYKYTTEDSIADTTTVTIIVNSDEGEKVVWFNAVYKTQSKDDKKEILKQFEELVQTIEFFGGVG